jgi:hypothetical protein
MTYGPISKRIRDLHEALSGAREAAAGEVATLLAKAANSAKGLGLEDGPDPEDYPDATSSPMMVTPVQEDVSPKSEILAAEEMYSEEMYSPEESYGLRSVCEVCEEYPATEEYQEGVVCRECLTDLRGW